MTNAEQNRRSENTNKDKATSPINYPNYRSQKGNISIPSETNVELSREWVEFNKL